MVLIGQLSRLQLRWTILDSQSNLSFYYITLEQLYMDVIGWVSLILDFIKKL